MTTRGWRSEGLAALFLLAGLVATFLLYRPGLSGTFLFDDFVNLDSMADIRTGVSGLFDFVRSSVRPLAFLSFLINDHAWPSDPRPFLYTNLLLHLLTGTVLVWVLLLSARTLGMTERSAQWSAVLGGVLWLVHPLMVSTTLYVVQRMTILGALFVLLALLSYLHGRRRVAAGQPKGYLWLVFAVPGFAGVGLLGKEIAALTPVFLLLYEHVLLKNVPVADRHFRLWRTIYIYVPIALLVAALVVFYPDWSWIYQSRQFTLEERLLTQPHVLTVYLGLLVLPKASTMGLLYENFPVSRSLVEPWMTLPSLLLILGLLVLGLLLRRRSPVAAMAILFFLGGHLLESTFLGLELYFEHRNYLPSVFLFFGLAVALVRLYEHRKAMGVLASAAVLGILGGLTGARASLWGEPLLLLAMWVEKNPGSERTYVAFSNMAGNRGRIDLVGEYLNKGIERVPDAPHLVIGRLQHECHLGEVVPEHVDKALEVLRETLAARKVYVYENLRGVVEVYGRKRCEGLDFETLRQLSVALLENEHLEGFHMRLQEIAHLQGLIEVLDGNYAEGRRLFETAFRLLPLQPTALQQGAILASHDQYRLALEYLEDLERFHQREHRFIHDADAYEEMMARLRRAIAAQAPPDDAAARTRDQHP